MYMLSHLSLTAMQPAKHDTVPTVPLTRARVQLFQIADAVLSGETPRVILSHRDRGANVVMIAATELEKIEQDLAALRAQANVGPLRGLGTLHAPLDDILGAIRSRDNDLAASKRSTFGERRAEATRKSPARAAEDRPRGYRARKPRP
jgi:hypothetical protein